MSGFGDRIAHEWDPDGAVLREDQETAAEELDRLLKLREAANPWLDGHSYPLDDHEGTDFD